MGIWSPAAYDALLLEKIKSMLSSHLNSPKHATIRTTYEQFVLDLDVQDEGSKNAIKSLLRQTVVRRRLLPHSQPAHPTVTEPSLTYDTRSGGLLFGSSVAPSSTAASTSNEPALELEAASRATANAWTTIASNGRETNIHAPSGPIVSLAPRRSTNRPDEASTLTTTRIPRPARVNDSAAAPETTLNDDPRLSWQQFLSESTGADQSTFETTLGSSSFIPSNAPSTSMREIVDLPSHTTAGDSGYHLYNDVPSPPARVDHLIPVHSPAPSTRATTRTTLSIRARPAPPPPPPRVANLRPPPTAEQIWSTLFDEIPFPLDDLMYIPFEVFLLSLNEVMDPPIAHATTFSTLCDELQCRDPGFNIRLRGVQRRQGASRLLYELRNVASVGGGGRDMNVSVEEATREDGEREREGRRRSGNTTVDEARGALAREDIRRFREEMQGVVGEDEEEDGEEGEEREEEEDEDPLMSGPFFDPDFNYDQDMSDSQDEEGRREGGDPDQDDVAHAEEDFRDYSSRLRSLLRRGADEWVQEVLRLEERTSGSNDRTERTTTTTTNTTGSTPVLETTTTTTAATSTNTSPPPTTMGDSGTDRDCPLGEGTSSRRPNPMTLTTSTSRTSAEIAEAAQRANRRIRPIPSRSQALTFLSSSSNTTLRRSTTPATDPSHGSGSTGSLRRHLRLERVPGSGSGQTRWSWNDRSGREGQGEGEGDTLYPRFSTRRTMTTGEGAENDMGEDVYEGSRVFYL